MFILLNVVVKIPTRHMLMTPMMVDAKSEMTLDSILFISSGQY
jgi:hypothetical protein